MNQVVAYSLIVIGIVYTLTESSLLEEVRPPILHKFWSSKKVAIRKIGDLLSCPYCLSFWVANVVVLIDGAWSWTVVGATYGLVLLAWQWWFSKSH